MFEKRLRERSPRNSLPHCRRLTIMGLLPLLMGMLLARTPCVGAAESIRVGIAANFIQTAKELTRTFEEQTGAKVEATFASSGSLYAQIANGAPYDLFLSADVERPDRLHREALAETPFVYARGRIVLWSGSKDFCRARDWRQALCDPSVRRIAIANPETAPYGTAAREALRMAGLWESGQWKRVVAQDIAQAFQYASTEAVDGAFCAFSSVRSEKGSKGCHYEVPEAPEIIQSGCILKQAKDRAMTEKFAVFLQSSSAAVIKSKYGYR